MGLRVNGTVLSPWLAPIPTPSYHQRFYSFQNLMKMLQTWMLETLGKLWQRIWNEVIGGLVSQRGGVNATHFIILILFFSRKILPFPYRNSLQSSFQLMFTSVVCCVFWDLFANVEEG